MEDKDYNALYTYFIKDYDRGTFNRFQARCRVIGETAKSYRIKLIDLIQRRLPDEELWVRKRSIFRSRFNNATKRCDIYNIEVREESCRACLQNCYRRYEMRHKKLDK
jgi:hypothetical protein